MIRYVRDILRRVELWIAFHDPLFPVVRTIECAEDAVDAVTRVTEQDPNAPLVEPLNQKIADCLCHRRILAARPVPVDARRNK